jgi:uncharacterized protein (DUF1810 family)
VAVFLMKSRRDSPADDFVCFCITILSLVLWGVAEPNPTHVRVNAFSPARGSGLPNGIGIWPLQLSMSLPTMLTVKEGMNFDHFIAAQDGVYGEVVRELADGDKRSHWMWFIFPQLRGLGYSAMKQKFALGSLDEARRYLEHPMLGARLRECTRLVLATQNRSAEDIFGPVDAMKLRSSMTLFSLASAGDGLFDQVIEKYFAGEKDGRTLELLRTH